VSVGASAVSAPTFAALLDASDNAAWVWWVTIDCFLITRPAAPSDGRRGSPR
jgi:hypothetical protein